MMKMRHSITLLQIVRDFHTAQRRPWREFTAETAPGMAASPGYQNSGGLIAMSVLMPGQDLSQANRGSGSTEVKSQNTE